MSCIGYKQLLHQVQSLIFLMQQRPQIDYKFELLPYLVKDFVVVLPSFVESKNVIQIYKILTYSNSLIQRIILIYHQSQQLSISTGVAHLKLY